MSKRQQKSHRKPHHAPRPARPERQPPDLHARLLEATRLIEDDRPQEAIDQIVAGLDEADRTALRCVLTLGGQMPWTDFDAQFGNDMEESAHWHWHEPRTTMGRLRRHGLLVETTVNAELLVAIPLELRQPLASRLEAP